MKFSGWTWLQTFIKFIQNFARSWALPGAMIMLAGFKSKAVENPQNFESPSQTQGEKAAESSPLKQPKTILAESFPNPLSNLTRKDISIKLSEALGVPNLGSTCFANAVLKLLWADGRFSTYVIGKNPLQKSLFSLLEKLEVNWKQCVSHPEKHPKLEAQFTEDLIHFYDQLEEKQKEISFDGSESLDPSDVGPQGETLRLKKHQFDAELYLGKLIELVELGKCVPNFHLSSQVSFASLTKNPIRTDLDSDGTPAAYLKLILPIDQPDIESVAGALNAYFREEPLDVPIENESDPLHGRENGIRRNYLTLDTGSAPPSRMIFSLGRFQATQMGENRTMTKIQKKIISSRQISLDFYSIDPSNPRELTCHQRKDYNLKAIVVHHGGVRGGHYFTDLIENRTWFRHDDREVRPLAHFDSSIENGSYLFLYEQQH